MLHTFLQVIISNLNMAAKQSFTFCVASVNVGQINDKLGLERGEIFQENGPIDLLELIMRRCTRVERGNLKNLLLVGHLSVRLFLKLQIVDVKQSTRYYTSSPVVKSRRYDRLLDHAMEVSSKSCFCNPEKLSLIEQHEKKIIENLCERVGNQWMAAYPWKKDRNLLPENEARHSRSRKLPNDA